MKRIITVVVGALVITAIMLVMKAPAMARSPYAPECGQGEVAKPATPPRGGQFWICV